MYIKNNLVLDFDISNSNTFNINELSIESTTKWNNTKIDDISLSDYGLTQYDIGRTSSLLESKEFTINNDKYLKLERIGKPDENGNIDYSEHDILVLSGNTIGNYLYSTGGYLNNPFKYHNYNIEYLPRQYKNGFSLETTIFIDQNTFLNTDNNSNIFLFMGMRAEDKFADSSKGNLEYFTVEGATLEDSFYNYDISKLPENTQNIDNVITYLKTDTIYIKNNGQNEFILNEISSEEFTLILNQNKLEKNIDYSFDLREKKLLLIGNISLKTTDIFKVNYYTQLDDTELVNINLNNIDNKNTEQNIGINNNVIAFKFNKNKQIGYRKINENYKIEEKYSDMEVNYMGWNHIVITFNPYNKNVDSIDDDCNIIARTGTLKIYVNGILFLNIEDFIEPTFNALPTHESKQIGIPYNISWGGGTFGLKYSYNFNENNFNIPYVKNINNDNLIIERNFDGHFKGGFQKLRIYDKSLNLNEIKHNYMVESDYYDIILNRGGRIINK
jgi:hypothetical protein